MSELSENILRLRGDGKTYKEIQEILGCSKGTISYHLGEGQKEKQKARNKKLTMSIEGVLTKKVYAFYQERPKNPTGPATNPRSIPKVASDKVGDFCRALPDNKRTNYSFTYLDVVDKFKDRSHCYLTGEPIDLSNPRSYEFDHIIPRSRGGSNTFDNLEITTREANRLKGNLTLDELLTLCEKILAHHGRLAETDEPQLDNRQPIQ